MIYFAQCGEDGPIKIGCTDGSIVTRLRQLQGTSPHILIIRGVHPGDKKTEKELHDRFKETRVRAEWFHPSKALKEYIRNIPGGPLALYHAVERFDIREQICRDARRKWTAESRRAYRALADEFSHRLYRWREGAGPMPEDAAKAIENFLKHHVEFAKEAA